MKKAMYPGTFNPITNGHLDVIRKASKVFDEVIVAVASYTGKMTMIEFDERYRLCAEAVSSLPNVKVVKFKGLTVDFAREIGAQTMIRGLRAVSDFEYELSLAMMNLKLSEGMDTVFFLPSQKYLYLSSTMIRQVAELGGTVSDLVPECVDKYLLKFYQSGAGVDDN
ncbi:MAG: pantetheine-phosphate adenylyltransferase [Candidatus Cloacimonetes bacterium]|nr:pantetheine-phosphate adenylyltransferase [Candidatus Cloacimonadota bacterium]